MIDLTIFVDLFYNNYFLIFFEQHRTLVNITNKFYSNYIGICTINKSFNCHRINIILKSRTQQCIWLYQFWTFGSTDIMRNYIWRVKQFFNSVWKARFNFADSKSTHFSQISYIRAYNLAFCCPIIITFLHFIGFQFVPDEEPKSKLPLLLLKKSAIVVQYFMNMFSNK